MTQAPSQTFFKLLAWIGILTTVVVNPWFAFDPINLPKMLTLSVGSFFLTSLLLLYRGNFSNRNYAFTLCSIILLITLAISITTNESPWYQQFWGTWGRSTGLLTYCAFVFVMLCAFFLSSDTSLHHLRISFDRLGYFMSFYVLIQYLQLDPINWSQKLMIGTLGNLNFMSSFLGLTSISYVSRIILEKLNASAKVFYSLLIALNLFLIAVSQSIQGFGVYFAGLVIVLLFYFRRRFSSAISIGFLTISISVGIFIFLGTAGIGPLSTLEQATVLYRLDYWQSGINMVMAHPVNGVGIDSYGDYYREFRTLEAVERTGPQRVTNTAHNIFLDISTGSGIVAGLMFTLLMFLTIISILRGLNKRISNVDFQAFGAMCLGFLFFCLISINQIGVGVWGFIFIGLVNGYTSQFQLKSSKESTVQKLVSNKKSPSNKSKFRKSISLSSKSFEISDPKWVASGVVALMALTLSISPNIADAQFLAAIRASNLNQAINLVSKPGIQDFHLEQLMVKLIDSSRESDALDIALLLSKRNPRNWQAWVQIVKSKVSSNEQRREAADNLMRFDPNNELIRIELNDELMP